MQSDKKISVEKEYVLGTDKSELERLSIQHRVWADVAVRSWKMAGMGPGSRVLDLGCGPGHATFDIAQLVSYQGEVVAFDESQRFLNHVNQQAKAWGLTQVKTLEGDAQNLPTKALGQFDVIYCRWVLCWLRDPKKTILDLQTLLKPGGWLIIHDYFNWGCMTMAPRSPSIMSLIQCAIAHFQSTGGNIDVAAHIPAYLCEAHLNLKHFEIHQRAPRGGGLDSTLAWPVTWWLTFGAKLAELGKFPMASFEQVQKDLSGLQKNPSSFFVCPPVFEFLAQNNWPT